MDEDLQTHLLSTITSAVPLDIRISSVEGAGHGVVAQSDLAAGVEAFRVNTPFVVGLSEPNTTCDNCLLSTETKLDKTGRYTTEKLQLKECRRCHSVKYCNKACQVSAWSKYHKFECRNFAREYELENQQRASGRPKPGPQTRAIKTAVMRIIKMYSRNEISTEERHAIDNLESHQEEYADDTLYQDFLGSSLAGTTPGQDNDMSADEIFDIYCKILTNSISIRQPNTDHSLGINLDLFCSMINHSCNPNIFYFFEGNQLRCRTLRAISSGEELFISYTDPTYDVQSRRKELLTGYCFKCTCQRCENEIRQVKITSPQNIVLKLEMQEKLLQSQYEITVRALRPDAIEEHIRAIWARLPHEVRKQLSLEDGWSEYIQPMPDMRFFIARLTQSTDTDYSLKTLVKLCFVTYPRLYGGMHGREWVMAFWLLVFTLRLFIKHKDANDGHRNLSDWSLVYIVYLDSMSKNAEECYGHDTAFVMANKNLLRQETSHLAPSTARSAGLVSQFRSDQREMLAWAGVTSAKGVELSDAGLIID